MCPAKPVRRSGILKSVSVKYFARYLTLVLEKAREEFFNNLDTTTQSGHCMFDYMKV
jgi:hypothetical protein